MPEQIFFYLSARVSCSSTRVKLRILNIEYWTHRSANEDQSQSTFSHDNKNQKICENKIDWISNSDHFLKQRANIDIEDIDESQPLTHHPSDFRSVAKRKCCQLNG